MRMSLEPAQLAAYVGHQLDALAPDAEGTQRALERFLPRTLERVEHCFSRIANKYFSDGEGVRFDHLHTDQYAMFLYYLANTVWRESADRQLAGRLYVLNKALHSLDAYYEVALPDIFMLVHPLGTILGRATYADYLVVYQGCTVGSTPRAHAFPVIGERVVVFGNTMILGQCDIGHDSVIAAGSLLINTDVPADSLAVGRHPKVTIRPAKDTFHSHYFRVPTSDHE
jgi:serine O-acetyltransferase